jgi:hypothetical protein
MSASRREGREFSAGVGGAASRAQVAQGFEVRNLHGKLRHRRQPKWDALGNLNTIHPMSPNQLNPTRVEQQYSDSIEVFEGFPRRFPQEQFYREPLNAPH